MTIGLDDERETGWPLERTGKLRAWLAAHGDAFRKAIGTSADDDLLVLLLDRVTRGFGRLPGWKDRVDRRRCDVLDGFMRGEPTDERDLRIAIDLLRVSFNMAVDELLELRLAEERRKHQVPPYGSGPRPPGLSWPRKPPPYPPRRRW